MREVARQQGTGQRGRMGAMCGQKMKIVHLNRKVGNNVGTVWKGRAVWWDLTLSLCSQERSGESETDSQQGAPSSFFPSLLLHTPPTPAPPLGTCLLPEFLFLSYSIHSFLFFFVICLSTLPSLLFFTFDWHWHRHSVWRQGLLITSNMPGILCTVLHAFTWHQGNWLFAYKAFLLSFYYVPLLLCSLILSPYYLFFVITMRLPQPLPLIFSAGFEDSLWRTHSRVTSWNYKRGNTQKWIPLYCIWASNIVCQKLNAAAVRESKQIHQFNHTYDPVYHIIRYSFYLSNNEKAPLGGEDTVQVPSPEKQILIPAYIIFWTLGEMLRYHVRTNFCCKMLVTTYSLYFTHCSIWSLSYIVVFLAWTSFVNQVPALETFTLIWIDLHH